MFWVTVKVEGKDGMVSPALRFKLHKFKNIAKHCINFIREKWRDDRKQYGYYANITIEAQHLGREYGICMSVPGDMEKYNSNYIEMAVKEAGNQIREHCFPEIKKLNDDTPKIARNFLFSKPEEAIDGKIPQSLSNMSRHWRSVEYWLLEAEKHALWFALPECYLLDTKKYVEYSVVSCYNKFCQDRYKRLTEEFIEVLPKWDKIYRRRFE